MTFNEWLNGEEMGRQFNEGLDQVKDEELSGSSTLVTAELVHGIYEKIREDCQFTINALSDKFHDH